MRRVLCLMVVPAVLLGLAVAGWAGESTLEKIYRTGVFTVGTRSASPPFGYINKQNEWVGFSIDLVDALIKPEVEKAVGKSIKIEKKESTPPTRIPLLTSNAVDVIAETMTDTPQRRETVDFSLTYFYTGAQFLVKKGSPVKGVNDIAGKRIASQQGSTNAKIIREKYPQAQLREFPDQPAAFQALVDDALRIHRRIYALNSLGTLITDCRQGARLRLEYVAYRQQAIPEMAGRLAQIVIEPGQHPSGSCDRLFQRIIGIQ